MPVVIDFAGCPGDSDKAKYPNWVTCPWPPEYLDVLDWQWEKKVIPYWTKRAKFAEDHGVKIAIEMHPGFVAYSPETMLRLRSAAGKAIGVNYDPSHMFWQGIDPIAAVRVLGNSIFHVHAKDTQIYERNLPMTGVLDTKKYTDERNRAWIFRTVGYGHGAEWWSEFISTLRMFGYDYVLSIEHEDSILSPNEGLTQGHSFPGPDRDEGAAGRGMVGLRGPRALVCYSPPVAFSVRRKLCSGRRFAPARPGPTSRRTSRSTVRFTWPDSETTASRPAFTTICTRAAWRSAPAARRWCCAVWIRSGCLSMMSSKSVQK